MTDRPIIFSAPMIRALLDGRKTQTRRVLKPQPCIRPEIHEPRSGDPFWCVFNGDEIAYRVSVPYAIGDRLWVRENHSYPKPWADNPDRVHFGHVFYPASTDAPFPSPYLREKPADHGRIRSSIHMPRWASRLTLTVTDVRVQRLQEISEADAVAEGGDAVQARMYPELGTCRDWYADLWDSLHGPDAWDANPWVVALSFTVQRGNIDQIGGTHD